MANHQASTAPAAPTPTKRKSHKFRWFLLAVIAVIGIFMVTNSVKGGTSTATSAAPAAAAAPVAKGIGATVRDGKFEFMLVNTGGITAAGGNEYLDVKPQGEFVTVTIRVTNIGDEPQTFFGSTVKALDNAGRTMAPDTKAAIFLLDDANSFITPINPGNTVSGTLIFDVPVGSTLTSIELHDSMFSGGATIQL